MSKNLLLQWTIVGIALIYCVVYIVRSVTKKKQTESRKCSSCCDCPLTDECQKKPDALRKGRVDRKSLPSEN